MTIAQIWYTLVALYLFWLTAIAALSTALIIGMFKRWRALTAQQTVVTPQPPRVAFDRTKLPRRHHK